VLELKENAVTVKFENIVTDVKKEFSSVYSCVNDRVVASRLQIPLVLSFISASDAVSSKLSNKSDSKEIDILQHSNKSKFSVKGIVGSIYNPF
jgi:hypothetical protein